MNFKPILLNLCLGIRFTDGKKRFKVIGMEFRPPWTPYQRFIEFIEEGTHPTVVRLREAEYMNKLLKNGKLRFID